MAKLSIKPGSTNVSLPIFIQDSTSTVGAGKTGLAYNTSSLVCYYMRPGSAAASLSLVTQTVTGAHTDGGFVEIDATNMPGAYRLDLHDNIVAAGVRSVLVMLKGATGMAPLVLEIDLKAEVDTTHLAGTVQTARDIGASVLLSSGTGTGQISLSSGAVTAGTVSDKTGYALADDAITAAKIAADAGIEIGTAVWATASRTLTSNTNLNDPTAAAIADAVWDEARSGHTSAGSFGQGVASVQGNVTGSTASIAAAGITSTSFDTGAITATAIAADAIGASELATDAVTEIANAVAALTVDGMTLQNAIKLILAAAAGKVSGADGTTITIRDTTDTYNRIVATVDQYGNRSAVSYVTT